MSDAEWIDAKTACGVLGVKAQPLYAYIGRHGIRTRADPGAARLRLYSRRDVEALSQRTRRPRARAAVAQAAIRWGDPVLQTSISEVRDGTILLRGRAIEDCAQSMSLEQAAAWLCAVPGLRCEAAGVRADGRTPFARAMTALVAEVERATPMQGRPTEEMAQEAGRLISLVADACLGRAGDGPVHARVAAAWGLACEARDLIRRALVLLSDHELTPSTFAVRVCASTGASLPAALLAGMTTLSGPRHGGGFRLYRRTLHRHGRGQCPSGL